MIKKARLRAYYLLTKPGIIRGNLITAIAGFLLAAQGDIDWSVALAMTAGLGLIVASACVTNNILDIELDRRMERTAKRSLVSGEITKNAALIFATVLGASGVLLLLTQTTITATATAAVGWIAYVVIYGYYKRRSTLSTAIGSISGALPPVVGYTAVTNQMDAAAVILFLILTFWQLPHFFAIAVYRLKDYAAAGLPVLPVVKGVPTTRHQMIMYIIGYAVSSLALTAFGYTGMVYAVIMLLIAIGWLYVAIDDKKFKDTAKWGKQVFLISLIAISVQCLLIAVDSSTTLI